ncbi:MAG: alpha-galactosidase [Thermoflexales bacterium]|nr:alpha-galactosidase [Thermoflexales bacterium]
MSSTWELANQHIRRVIQFDPAVGLYTSHFVNLITGTDLIGKARLEQRWTPEFDFRVNGERLTSLGEAWELVEDIDGRMNSQQQQHEVGLRRLADAGRLRVSVGAVSTAEDNQTVHLTIRLIHRARRLEVYIGYRCDAHGTTKRLTIINTSDQPIIITHLALETLPVEIGTPGELQLDAHYAALPRETFITGRVDDCAIVYRNPRTGDCVFALNEAPGHLKRVETGAWFWDGLVRLMYDTDLFPLEIHLPSHTSWQSAATRIVLAATGQDYADPRWVMPLSTKNELRKPANPAKWHYNTWDPFGTRIDEVTVMQLIPIAARMGFEVFTIDDGWQARYGDNAISPDRFPNGLDRIREAVEANGMRLGLWAPLAVVDQALAALSPDLLCRDAHGQVKTTMTAMGEQSVMCLASDYARLAAARLIELIATYHLAYIKLDLTTVFNAYGEAPGCYAPNHQHANATESVLRIYEAIAHITQAVYAQQPDVLIDLTFELWGQKHTIDYGLLRAADLSWISNVGDNVDAGAGPRQARTLLYQRSLAIPVETMLIGNLRADTGDPREKFATALGSCPLLLGDLRRLSDEQIDWYGNMIRWQRQLRTEINLSESFFPLGSWRQPSVIEWDGFARLARSGEGLIVLFRNESTLAHAHVQVPLPGESHYTLTSIMTGVALDGQSAADFRAGFDVAFNHMPVVIIEVRQVVQSTAPNLPQEISP